MNTDFDNLFALRIHLQDSYTDESDIIRELKDYLLSCKKDGYTLVGLEQTSNSKSIENYNFQRKTAILLGKEQEGIPPEFIDMLEDCVEIPQFGIVRSLNVHVSGSILLWEYTRQGLVNKND